jgi:8-oxo-dGTP pyrophosphatase MutT (NUDIX family)
MPHINYAHDYTVSAFIVSSTSRVLLVNHPRYNKWIPVGGHVELNENPEDALYREVKEETGLDISKVFSSKPNVVSPGTTFLLTPNYVDVHEANPPHKHIAFTYFVRATGDDFVLSDEHTDMRWFAADELQDRKYGLSPAVIFYATEALKFA